MLGFLLAASGELRCAAPANCSEDHVASRRHSGVGGEGTVTAKTSVMRPQDTRHTAHTQTHTRHLHTSTRDSTSGEKSLLHSGPHNKGTTKQRTGARARSAP